MPQKLLLFFFLNFFYFSYASEIITIPSNQFNIDINKGLIVSNLDVTYINTTWVGEKTSLTFDVDYNFETPVSIIKIGIPYKVINSVNGTKFLLYFTELPLITISTDNVIVDEPNILGRFKLIESNQNSIVSNIGIQYRGASSQFLPKKPFEIKFWKDEQGNETQDVSLLGMHSDDGWNLQAMYNESLRFHSKTNNDLWKLIHKPYYINSEPQTVSGVEMKYAELFLNGEYRGIYCVGEKVNRKLLKLKKHNGNIRGELYKGDSWGGSTTFSFLSSYSNDNLLWGGFEYKYPSEVTDWKNLYDLTDFVINDSQSNFIDTYKGKFEINNAVDYFVFLNLLRALDNTGKNLYIAKYAANEPYFYVPWDLDGTFGTIWNGQRENITDDLLSNGMYNRLLNDCSADGFREKLNLRWNELRNSIITHSNLMNMLSGNYNLLKQNGVYERENIAWPEYSANESELDYISTWLTNRLAFLDLKFSEKCNTLDVATFDRVSKTTVYPNPTSDFINISLLDTGNHTIFLYDSMGKLILKNSFESNQYQFSIKDLSNGIYYLKTIDSENKIDVKSIIKQ
ncbi:CotH kinase family protein [Flavobacterium psychroterrae]|uniref:CotH kinase family protein n=1 Tax=Flavobacterium psychroterrae TaxID=2133767 RepID=A0ABS5P8S6_9FLAO|nr:CotH kinase family protein [Flavobacterium psychroterrae]MBS7230707.1 CotH kinase family protein [Flavobacterium psychroterrae]